MLTQLSRRLGWASIAMGALGLPGCFDTATVRDGRLRQEAMVSVAVPIYSGSLARGQAQLPNCPDCERQSTTLPDALDTQPLVAVRGGGPEAGWFAFRFAASSVVDGLGGSIMARFRVFAFSWAALAISGEAGAGVSATDVIWWNRVSLDASVEPIDWLSVYVSPHLGQMETGGEYWAVGTDVWGINGGLRWQLGAVVALYTELGWTRSMETPHSVITPALGVAFALPDAKPDTNSRAPQR